MIRVAIRGYVSGAVIFEDLLELDLEAISNLLPGIAEKHATAMAEHRLHMVEIEFLEEPDPDTRFFRMGTDPSMMVMPFPIDLAE